VTHPWVVRLLTSIGKPAEAEFYLSQFQALRPESFAVLWVDPDVSGALADALAFDLELLAELSLTPVLAFESKESAEDLAGRLSARAHARFAQPSEAAAIAQQGGIPLITLGDTGLAELATEMGTRKIVLLGAHGALASAGQRLSIIDVTADDAELQSGQILSAPHMALYQRARALVDAAGALVSITSPLELVRELFTVRGAGTLVRRGTAVAHHRDLAAVDRGRIQAIIEAAFARPLRAEFWHGPLHSIYVAGDYRGAALVTHTEVGPYLTKLAVGATARGEGIGRDLWRALVRDHARLFWRARPDNPITYWYRDQCEGMVKLPPWNIYWRGLDPGAIGPAIAGAQAAAVDFGERT